MRYIFRSDRLSIEDDRGVEIKASDDGPARVAWQKRMARAELETLLRSLGKLPERTDKGRGK